MSTTPLVRALSRPRAMDLVVMAGLFAWSVPDVPWWWRPPGHGAATPVVLGYLGLALATCLPFWWRRRLPAAVLAAATGVLAVRVALRQDPSSAYAAVLTGAYGMGAYHGLIWRRARWVGWAWLAVAALVDLLDNDNRLAAVPFALLGAAFLAGDAAAARRHEAAAQAEATAMAERTRIARELHDVLAHQLSAITLQAGAARVAGDPPPAEALATVEQLAREALVELGQLLGMLRREAGEEADRRPAPGLAELDGLLATAGKAGVAVGLAVTGDVRRLTPGLELSVYRIVQESLTNVARHAPGAPTLVTLCYDPDRLRLEVVNEPSPLAGDPPVPGSGGGRGLLGMRERAELYGGRLCAAARVAGGFAVTATLPYDGAAAR
ncbi:MAG: sensor histidine kinase [Mycobacteriales bacterium]